MDIDRRAQFLNYMTLHRFSPRTKSNYVLTMKGLVKFYNKPPETLSNEQIQRYLLYLIEEKKLAWGSVNNHLAGIACFYKNVMKWDETRFTLPPRPRIKKLPCILSEEEVKRLFDAATNLKHRVLLKTVYSAGLRISEVIRLRPEHIESDPSRMMIRIEQGKGRKDRYTVLSRKLLPELREYWRTYRPGQWLFPGQKRNKHITSTTAHKAFVNAKKKPVLPEDGESTVCVTRLQLICYPMGPIYTPSNDSLAIRP
jgi:site-specific recombinase XerD